jgi:PAS domain S-box-containing protein
MVYLDLILNLALLVALSIVSGFIEKRCPRSRPWGPLFQGLLFGGATVLGMLRPLVLGPGLIFDGRSVMLSLCALFFGPWAAATSGVMTIACRLWLGGVGTQMGVSVILASVGIGLLVRSRIQPESAPPSARTLYLFGLAVHLAMLALMFTLPPAVALATVQKVGLPVLLLYPLATVLGGKVLADQASAARFVEALRKSEETYRRLFEDHAAVKLIIDPVSGSIVDANQAAVDFYGWPRERLVGMKVQEINTLPPEALAREMEKARSQQRIRFAFRHRRADGSIRDVEVFSSRIAADGAEFLHSIVHDVTEQKRLEAQLRQSDDLLANLAAQVPGVVYQYRLHPDGRSCFPYASPGMQAIYEVAPEAVREDATPAFGRLHPEDRDRVTEAILESARTLEPFHCEFRVVLPRQGLRWRLSDAQPQRMADGGTLWHGIISDITARKRADAERERLLAAIEQTGEAVCITDVDGTIQYVNPAFEAVTGYGRGEAVGNTPRIQKSGRRTRPSTAYCGRPSPRGRPGRAGSSTETGTATSTPRRPRSRRFATPRGGSSTSWPSSGTSRSTSAWPPSCCRPRRWSRWGAWPAAWPTISTTCSW